MPPAAWRGEADRLRHVRIEDGAALGFPGPAELCAAFAHDPGELKRVLVLGEPLVVMTNLRQRGVLGEAQLGALIDPAALLSMPSLLGVARARGAVRGSLDADAAWSIAKVFVPTRAHARALDVLDRHGFCVLTGPPEMGKTATARVIALGLAHAGWEAHECTSPAELWPAFRPAVPQVFVCDDAFGSTEYRPDAADRWARELEDLLQRFGETGHHRLLWTSRPAPLKAGLARLGRDVAKVLVDASDLTDEERTLIVLRHGQALRLRDREPLVRRGQAIVAHPHYTPERVRRLVDRLPELVAAGAVMTVLAEPTTAMADSFGALEEEAQALLVAMLDQPPGPVEERALVHAMRELFPGAHRHAPAELVDGLLDHFLRRSHGRLEWVHPSWRDLVIDHVADDPERRLAFLGGCGVEGMLLALSIGGGPYGTRALPFLRADADWDLAADRLGPLVREADGPDLVRLLDGLAATCRVVRRSPELGPLAERLLGLVERRWGREPVPLAELESWYALRAWADLDRPSPDLRRTWVELLPAHLPEDEDEVLEGLDWVALIRILRRYDLDTLRILDTSTRRAEFELALVQVAELAPPHPVYDAPAEPTPGRVGFDVERVLGDLRF